MVKLLKIFINIAVLQSIVVYQQLSFDIDDTIVSTSISDILLCFVIFINSLVHSLIFENNL